MKLGERDSFAADSEVPIVLGPGRVGEKRLVFGCSMENWHEGWIWNRLTEPRLTCTNGLSYDRCGQVQTDTARGDSTSYRGIKVAVWHHGHEF
jgi:hypothetical protein